MEKKDYLNESALQSDQQTNICYLYFSIATLNSVKHNGYCTLTNNM